MQEDAIPWELRYVEQVEEVAVAVARGGWYPVRDGAGVGDLFEFGGRERMEGEKYE